MPTYALALVLVAALAHAAWNVLAKTAEGGAHPDRGSAATASAP